MPRRYVRTYETHALKDLHAGDLHWHARQECAELKGDDCGSVGGGALRIQAEVWVTAGAHVLGARVDCGFDLCDGLRGGSALVSWPPNDKDIERAN